MFAREGVDGSHAAAEAFDLLPGMEVSSVDGDRGAAASTAAPPHTVVTPAALASASAEFLRGVGALPGVVCVFPFSSGVARWFAGPVTAFAAQGSSVRVWITIGIDRHRPASATTGLVSAYLHARLAEHGFELIEVRIRIALLE
ncbi:MAG: hypothetical protein HIU86_13475 [Acidobacteria bacterium]|nr:hypothetical protein [Acidobacteriota bacterium]